MDRIRHWRHWTKRLWRVAQAVIPRLCLNCDTHWLKPGAVFCDSCITTLPLTPQNRCDCCGINLPRSGLCGNCLQKPPYFDQILAPYRYDTPISDLILRYKYQKRPELAAALSQSIIQFVAQQNSQPDLLIPVPLHPRRLRERGFNQSYELARHIGKALSIPVHKHAVERVIDTPPQAGLSKKERRRNIRHAFEVSAPLTEYSHIALVDDVVTTGSTVNALARLLKQKSSATQVSVYAIARTTKK